MNLSKGIFAGIFLSLLAVVFLSRDKTEGQGTGKAITHFYIDTTSSSPTGRWIAEVHIDDQFVRSYAFWLIEE
ncbi:MAG: hypothetical protein GXO75_08840 [Calditrichaeota bacterium]|nr:hypothetical protein [Calditrichota bacterium]